MKRLCDELNVNTAIHHVSANCLKDAIIYVYKNDDFKFYLNSELIDINDRFRIFNYNGKNYISKKTSKEDGENEFNLALKAKEKLDKIKVGKWTLNVVEPQLIIINNEYFIVTEYMGTSLQECMYDKNKKNTLKIDELFDILDLFINSGILYRGFLPRNIIINQLNIYLLDWEDVIFDYQHKGINTLWTTNFLLNWGYFFNIDDLKKRIQNYNRMEEPPLLKYEINFGKWILEDNINTDIRGKIFNTVMYAEKNITKNDDIFYIMPNDLAHLISDLFNSDIDVLFDISCFVLRQKSEEKYVNIVSLLSSLIAHTYINKLKIQPIAILLILMLWQIISENISDNIPLQYKDKDTFLNNLSNYSLVVTYMNENFNSFQVQLEKCLNSIINQYNEKDKKLLIINNLAKYIWSFKGE